MNSTWRRPRKTKRCGWSPCIAPARPPSRRLWKPSPAMPYRRIIRPPAPPPRMAAPPRLAAPPQILPCRHGGLPEVTAHRPWVMADHPAAVLRPTKVISAAGAVRVNRGRGAQAIIRRAVASIVAVRRMAGEDPSGFSQGPHAQSRKIALKDDMNPNSYSSPHRSVYLPGNSSARFSAPLFYLPVSLGKSGP